MFKKYISQACHRYLYTYTSTKSFFLNPASFLIVFAVVVFKLIKNTSNLGGGGGLLSSASAFHATGLPW